MVWLAKSTFKNTVQDHLEDAIKKFSLEKIKVICAGRTDAGVHAKEQVAHFDTNLNRERHNWLRGINSFTSFNKR